MNFDGEFENNFPLPLTKQEEKFYIERMQQGDKQAKEKLILHNMRLVVFISKKYFAPHENEDLISIGYFGLVKGLESFKIDKNIKLATYLGKCIENEILMHLRKLKKHEQCVSLETVLSRDKNGKDFKLLSIIADESETNFIHQTNCILDKDQVLKLIQCLNELELKVITLRYGLDDGIIRAQNEIAELLGCSRSYISRIERDAINKMRDELTFNDKFRENNTNF